MDLELRRGETTAIVGQNGSGKTTLAYHLVGILQPTNPEGSITVDGVNTTTTPVYQLIRHVNYVFQNPDDQLFQESLEREIEYGLANLGVPPEERARRTERALALFGLEPYRRMPPKGLSRGLRTRTAIASIAAMQPSLLIVDEPTTGLDRRESLEILSVLQQLAAEGTTLLFISHEMDLVAQYAQRVVVMSGGRVILDGTPAQVFAQGDALTRVSLKPPDIYQLSALLGWHDFENLRTPADLAARIQAAL